MQNLIQIAKEKIDKRYKKGSHSVGAAVKVKSGKIYTGISINSQKVDLCSEWTAIGNAISEGDADIEMVVAVKRFEDGNFEILPPCALCRELYLTYCPNAEIIMSDHETMKATDLLPRAWQKKRS
jgi:cytidine deaminase